MCQLDQMTNTIYLVKVIQCVTYFSLDMADVLLFFFFLSMFTLDKNYHKNNSAQQRICYIVLVDVYKNYKVLFGENNYLLQDILFFLIFQRQK